MLIVDSPFPPYAPVDRDVFEWPDLNVEGGHKLTGVPANNVTDYIWTKDNALHREGDLPAVIDSEGSACFFAMDIKHRVNGASEFVPARRGVLARRRFYLYGYRLTEAGFRRVHGLAIKYELPVWVVVFGLVFKDEVGSITRFAAETQKLSQALNGINIDWLTKLWNITGEGKCKFYGDESYRFSGEKFLHNLKRIVEAEKAQFLSHQ